MLLTTKELNERDRLHRKWMDRRCTKEEILRVMDLDRKAEASDGLSGKMSAVREKLPQSA